MIKAKTKTEADKRADKARAQRDYRARKMNDPRFTPASAGEPAISKPKEPSEPNNDAVSNLVARGRETFAKADADRDEQTTNRVSATREEAEATGRAIFGAEAKAGEHFFILKTVRVEYAVLTPEQHAALPKAEKPARVAGEKKPSGGNLATLIEMLRRSEGATTTEVCAVIPSWQDHTARARIGSDVIKAGHKVTRVKDEARGGTVYRIAA